MRRQEIRTEFLHSLNYFRAVAIIFIVAAHCYGFTGWQTDTIFQGTLANFFLGGTALFVFISGFLFHHIFYKRFQYGPFISKKIQYVLVPYLVLSSAALLYDLWSGTGYPAAALSERPSMDVGDYLSVFAVYYGTGRGTFAYWYIPFIMAVFLLSPVFIAYIKLGTNARLSIFSVTLLVSTLIHRSVDDLSVIQSVVYYSPVYLFGILASQHKERLYAVLGSKTGLLFITAVGLAVLQAVFYGNAGKFHKDAFALGPLDINLVQKLVLCMFFLVYLRRFEARVIALLNLLAASSFAIFFLHPFAVAALGGPLLSPLLYEWIPLSGGVRWVLSTFLVVILSVALAVSIKRLMPSRSRYLIGW